MQPYVIRENDYLQRVAFEFDFDGETVWNDDANADLRQLRPDPNFLLAGDVLYIPDQYSESPVTHVLAAGSTTTFVATDPPTVTVSVKFVGGDDSTYAGKAYSVQELEDLTGLTTDGDGVASFEAPVTLETATIVFDDSGETLALAIGVLTLRSTRCSASSSDSRTSASSAIPTRDPRTSRSCGMVSPRSPRRRGARRRPMTTAGSVTMGRSRTICGTFSSSATAADAVPDLKPEDPDSGPAPVCVSVAPGGKTSTIVCAKPPSKDWFLFVHIDTQEDDWESACRAQHFGHAFVEFYESNQTRYTYGFYPKKNTLDEAHRSVPGSVHHPDTTHMDSIDATLVYWLTQSQYSAALQKAQDMCRAPPNYGVDNTCVNFVEDILAAAGQSMPSATSEATTIFYQAVPPIDNPNTLIENVRKVLPRRTPFWNNQCINYVEAEFQKCLDSSTDGGMVCIVGRGAGMTQCQPGR